MRTGQEDKCAKTLLMDRYKSRLNMDQFLAPDLVPPDQIAEYWQKSMEDACRKGAMLAKQRKEAGVSIETYYWPATSCQLGNVNQELKKELWDKKECID